MTSEPPASPAALYSAAHIMPAYRTTTTYQEDGVGTTTEVFVIADTYEALLDLEDAVEVNTLAWESVKQDADSDTGQRLPAEISFTMDEDAAASDDDLAAIEFALETRSEVRYCALLINPATPAVDADVRARGLVRRDVQGTADRWSGIEWSGDVQPIRFWKFTAVGVDIGVMLDNPLRDVVAMIDEEWIEENVADRLGPFKDGTREIRFGDLVAFDVLMTKLFSLVAPAGVTMAYETAPSGWYCWRARWKYDTWRSTRVLRYSSREAIGIDPITGLEGIMPWEDINQHIPLNLGDDLFIDFKMLRPHAADEPFSWLRYGTLGELIYAIAFEFDCYTGFTYEGDTITMSFRPAASMVGTEIELRDAMEDKVDLRMADDAGADAEPTTKWSGASTTLLREGLRQYSYDGGFYVPRPADRVSDQGERLALTIGPAFCYLQHMGRDLDIEMDGACFPHNAIMYDAGSPRGDESNPEDSLRGLSSAIYIRTGGTIADGTDLVYEEVYMPITGIRTQRGGTERQFREMVDVVQLTRGVAGDYASAERNISIDARCCWRVAGQDPPAAADWRPLNIGATLTLEGQSYVVMSWELKAAPIGTSVRLEHAGRFEYTTPPLEFTSADTAISPAPARIVASQPLHVITGTAVGTIEAGMVVSMTSTNSVIKARAHHLHYGLVRGLALHDAAVGDPITVQTAGRFILPDSISFAPNMQIWLRTTLSGSNLSSTALATKTASEDMIVPVGRMTAEGTLYITIGRCIVFDPPLEDV